MRHEHKLNAQVLNVCTTENVNENTSDPSNCKFVSSFSVDYSITGRAKCQRCKKIIIKNDLRIGKSKLFKAKEISQFYHVACAFTMFRSAKVLSSIIKTENEMNGFNVLATDDKQLLRKELSKIQHIIDELNIRATNKLSNIPFNPTTKSSINRRTVKQRKLYLITLQQSTSCLLMSINSILQKRSN